MGRLRGGAAVMVLSAVLLAACGGGETPAPAPPAADAGAAPAAAAPAAEPTAPVAETSAPAELVAGAGSVEVAEAALREQRLFTPAGDNAFELFLLASERDPGLQRVRDALTDLFPYAVLHVEQRTAARDALDARRVLDLMARAQPDAPALERLERELERLERRLATEVAQQQAAAARTAAAPAPTPAPAPVASAPAPSPAEPVVAEPPPAPAPAAVAPEPVPPPAAAPTPAPARVAATPPQPKVLRQPPLRYPEQAMRQGIEGRVIVDFQINVDGSVSDVRVQEATPQGVFEREALAVVRRTRFEPPPEPVRARRTIEFSMDR